ncbi:AMP-binding protein [Alcanivorax sp. 1008]|uniref:AMP-binding protein n=1 Tax=Alcanivorax sp. 1008 TaxID=2816853 RepID=UPI001E4B5500|nr:AMP-binding protein [Alcanivorax sp. 1008]
MSAMKTPLQAFADTVQKRGKAVAMIQPLGGGRLREYNWLDIQDEALRVASYLRGLNLPEKTNIALMSKNCAEWIIADIGIWMAGHISVPLYPTLTSTSVRQILEHSGAPVLFVGKLDVWDEAQAGVPDGIHCVAFSLAPDDARSRFPVWEDIISQSQPLSDPADPAAESVATIIYTSGTTGMPKGVMHGFGNFALVGTKLVDVYNLQSSDRMISYLPLSHIAERAAVELALIYVGHEIHFAESLDTFADDIKRARPTLFFAVPRIWTKFYQKVGDAMPAAKLRRLLRIPILNRVVKKKILSAMGLADCRIALSGAAALSPEVIEWFKRLDFEILEVYGMTENMAWSHTTRSGDQRVGWVGLPNDGVECRIGDGGEILVRSPGNMLGYYKEQAQTDEAFVDGGWLRTGDVGELDSQGRLRITGRVKEIFKTEKGKYVAPAPIENRLVSFPGVEQACVMGPGLPQPIALLNLSAEESARLEKVGREAYSESLGELLTRVNKELDAHERLQCLVVVPEIWSVENGMLTPTLKMKRNELEKLYADRVPEWARGRGVIWG